MMTDLQTIRGDSGLVPIHFGRSFVASEAFRVLFREGMTLIEDTAAYLDGPGRDDARTLARPTGFAYATESMRLTTRLMQIASWLLVQRAVAEGEMTPEQAAQEKTRVRLTWQDRTTAPEVFAQLPERLRALIDQSLRVQARIMHLDAQISDSVEDTGGDSPVARQWGLLRSAFAAS